LPVFATPLLLPVLLASAPDVGRNRPPDGDALPAPTQWAQLTIEQRVIIRIPTVRSGQRSSLMREDDASPLPAPAMKEEKGPKCLQLNRVRGAVINPTSGVTMLTVPRERFRTHLGRACRAADFYSGFYIEPNKDGAICAGRDTLHARNGSTCEIVKFSRLVVDEGKEKGRDR